ncbi:MAG: hypothetical protein U0931_34125 [Vulcanimicrobiota bacterium]
MKGSLRLARPRRGASLLELMAAVSLSLLALSVLASVIVPAFKATGQSGARLEMQQQATVVLRRISRDMQRSLPEGLALLDDTNGLVLSIHAIVGVAGSEPPVRVFARQLVFYAFRPADGSVRREVWPADPAHPGPLPGVKAPDGTVALAPTPASLQWVLSNPLSGQRLASQVKSLKIETSAPSPSVASPVTLTIEMERALPGRTRPTRFSLSQVLSLRNNE